MNALAVLAAVIVMLPWWVRNPVRSVYVLFGAAVLFEVFPLYFPDSLTDNVPFFWNLNAKNSLGFSFLPISPAEIAMVAALAVWWFSPARSRDGLRPSGRLVVPYSIFGVVVLLAEVRGILSGGDWNISLWELRPQVYGLIMFVLAASLIRDRSQLLRLGAIFFAAVGIKAGLGFYRYFGTLGRVLGNRESVMAHEESYFFAVFLLGVVIALIWYRKRIVLLLLALAPLVTITMLENQRRAAILALGAGMVVLCVVSIRFESALRRQLVATSVAALLGAGLFATVFWNHNYGTIGQVIRPVQSLFQPDPRDAQSDAYRLAENANLFFSYQVSPAVGLGFGRPMLYVFPMADISAIYPLWNYIPHNTLLWIGMRMGAIGLIAFWALIGMAILEAAQALGVRRDPVLRAAAAFAIVAVVAELVVAWGDLQLENYRNMMVFGMLLGIIDAIPRIPDAPPQPRDGVLEVPDAAA